MPKLTVVKGSEDVFAQMGTVTIKSRKRVVVKQLDVPSLNKSNITGMEYSFTYTYNVIESSRFRGKRK